jgi:primosomal protein N' (replication factor Y)
MDPYVDVLPDPGRALGQLFTYHVPPELEATITIGAQVLVPFGTRTVVGLVVASRGETDLEEVKDVEALLEGGFALPADALPLATWIADYYLCELGEAIRLFLPHGACYRIVRHFQVTGGPVPSSLRAHKDAGPVLRVLEGAAKEMSLAGLRRLVPGAQLPRGLRLLKSHGLVRERASLRPPQAGARMVRAVELAVDWKEAERQIESMPARSRGRVACLRAAAESGPVSVSDLAARAGVSPAVVRALLKAGLLRVRMVAIRRTPWPHEVGPQLPPPELTADQAEAAGAIGEAVSAGRHESFLLYGVTASGKTEVFLREIERVLGAGRQAIVLMPEISLTAQALGIYRGRFGDRVAILHSALSPGERWDEWQRIRAGEAGVIIGARSALFAPAPALGLIVVDEEHESSYKQEQAPRYHAREVALKRGEMNCCPVVLASATPSLESFYQAEAGHHRLLRLSTRVEQRPLPQVHVVDMRGRTSRPAIFSSPLRQAIAARLQAGEQMILFLNRRGYATFVLCPACGEAVRCPDCGVALTFHQDQRQVRCHHCGLARAAPDVCGRCGSLQIRFSGFGTERVEKELARLFPRARSGRLDRDSVARKDAHVRIVGSFRAAETDVLVGTQMVAKGFDFPGVTLVGVISADTSLNLPDFRAAERTFQLLTQVSGRSGRGEKAGEVVVQTYQPDHYSVQAAAAQDYDAFYRREIEIRRELSYPPFSQLVNLTVTSPDAAEAARRAEALAGELRERAGGKLLPNGEGGAASVLGPAPAPIARLRGRYRWHVLVKGEQGKVAGSVRDSLAALRLRSGQALRQAQGRPLRERPAVGRGSRAPSGAQRRATAAVAVDVDPVSLM